MSGELSLTELATNQTGKEATINDIAGQLEAAIAGVYTADASAGNVVLTADDLKRCCVVIVKNATVARNITLAVVKRVIKFVSDVSSTHSVSVILGSTTLVLPSAQTADYRLDGTANGLFVAGGGGDGTSLPAGGTTGQVLKKVSGADGDVAWGTDATGSGGGGGSGGSPVHARYLKLITHNPTQGLSALNELVARAGHRTVSLAFTATASTSYSGFPATNLNDNDVMSVWASNGEDPATLILDFAAAVDISYLTLFPRMENFNNAQQAPKYIDVSYSTDGVTYTVLRTFYMDPWQTGQAQTISLIAA